MEAQLSTRVHPKTNQGESTDLMSLWFLWRWCIALFIGLLWTTAIAIMLKRSFGALSVSLEFGPFVIAGAGLSLAIVGISALWNMAPMESPWRTVRGLKLLALGSPPIAVVIFFLAVTLPGTPVGAQVVFWTLVISAETIALHRAFPALWSKFRISSSSDNIGADHSVESSASTATPMLENSPLRDDLRIDPPQTPVPHIPSENISQQFTRHIEADGSDVLQGWVRTSFAPRQRTGSAHIAFCPPFERMPSLYFEQAEGPPTRVKPGQLLLHGTRLDLRLDFELDEPATVLLEFSVRLSPAQEPV